MALFQKIISATNWKYAAAEVALIVIGITIALWADSWVGERRNEQREFARLTALHADTEKTLAAISAIRKDTSNASIALREILELQPPYVPESETLELLRHGLLFGVAFHPEMSVYDDLKNSGELALLTDPSLRRLLSSMEAGLEQIQAMQADLLTVQHLNIDSYMVDRMDLTSFYGEMTGLKQGNDSPPMTLDFVAEREFRNRVLLKLDVVTQLESVFEEAESRVFAVKGVIEKQL